MCTIELTAGRMLCGKIRNFLNRCKFEGMNIEFIESSGWITRDFVIKGDAADMNTIKGSLDIWSGNL